MWSSGRNGRKREFPPAFFRFVSDKQSVLKEIQSGQHHHEKCGGSCDGIYAVDDQTYLEQKMPYICFSVDKKCKDAAENHKYSIAGNHNFRSG